MGFIDPQSPVYNTILFYIFIILILVFFKPNFMYCDKTKKFKSFGLGEDKTLFSFPLVCITCVISLYLVFLTVEILNGYLDSTPNQ